MQGTIPPPAAHKASPQARQLTSPQACACNLAIPHTACTRPALPFPPTIIRAKFIVGSVAQLRAKPQGGAAWLLGLRDVPYQGAPPLPGRLGSRCSCARCRRCTGRPCKLSTALTPSRPCRRPAPQRRPRRCARCRASAPRSPPAPRSSRWTSWRRSRVGDWAGGWAAAAAAWAAAAGAGPGAGRRAGSHLGNAGRVPARASPRAAARWLRHRSPPLLAPLAAVDTHVWAIACRHYTPHLRGRSLTPKLHGEVQAAFVQRFGPCAGWAHSILFIAELASTQKAVPALAAAGRGGAKRKAGGSSSSGGGGGSSEDSGSGGSEGEAGGSDGEWSPSSGKGSKAAAAAAAASPDTPPGGEAAAAAAAKRPVRRTRRRAP